MRVSSLVLFLLFLSVAAGAADVSGSATAGKRFSGTVFENENCEVTGGTSSTLPQSDDNGLVGPHNTGPKSSLRNGNKTGTATKDGKVD